MKLFEAVDKGKAKTASAKAKNLNKVLAKPMTANFFISLFNNQFKVQGFGVPAAITKQDKGMLNHLITYLKVELGTKEIADIAKSIVSRWRRDFAGIEFNTVNGKKVTMPNRPSLRVFLWCKNDVISFMTQETKEIEFSGKRPIIPE